MQHDEFWGLTPKEVFLSIKASRAREDTHYMQMAVFFSSLMNAAGNLKKPATPDSLYEPLLRPADKRETEEEKRDRIRELKRETERLAALAPAPVVRADPDFTP